MRLTVATEEGDTFSIDVDPGMELENVSALLEADVSHHSTDEIAISCCHCHHEVCAHADRALTSSFPQTGVPVDQQLLFASGKQMSGKNDTLAVC